MNNKRKIAYSNVKVSERYDVGLYDSAKPGTWTILRRRKSAVRLQRPSVLKSWKRWPVELERCRRELYDDPSGKRLPPDTVGMSRQNSRRTAGRCVRAFGYVRRRREDSRR